jgi:signal transduction histidine kinase
MWAEMLAGLSRQHTRLSRLVERQSAAIYRSRLLTELETERGRIARELHSGAGQPLSGIKLNTELLGQWVDQMPEEGRETVHRLTLLAESAMEQIRAVSHRLHPSAWNDLAIGDALRKLAQNSGILQSHPKTRIDIGPISAEPDWTSKMALYRCAQECISNAIRHSDGTEFVLTLREAGGLAEMRISDNGKGIQPGAMESGGIGLRSVREWATAAGGECEIGTRSSDAAGHPGGGTTITIRVPLGE